MSTLKNGIKSVGVLKKAGKWKWFFQIGPVVIV
jgi:hypothetical protein